MTKDMTSGKITPLLINFTIPLVLGNLFQLTYNAADSIIVGKFVGEDALAAVGTANPLMTLAILFINGICLGAGILVSTAFGAGDTELVERQVSTTAIAGTVFSLAFSLLCILLANPLLRLLQVPAEILPIAVNYLRIVFAGLLFTFIYNFLAATLRALGDSKSALYFLMISAVLNIGGDLFFVEALDWGSEGCALSTVLSEGMCCLLCALYIRWKVPVLQLGRRWFVFDGKLLRKTVSYGWVSAMQQATVQLGKIAVQAIVNTMGVSAMAAFTAASRIDDFAYTPQQNIAHACAAVGEHSVERDKTTHGQAVLGLVVVDGMAARDRATGLDALIGTACQNLAGNLNAQAARDAQQVHGMARPPAHGVDVRQRVGRGDLAKQERVVDHRREEVDGLHEAKVLPYAEDARIVGGIEPHEQVVVMHIG